MFKRSFYVILSSIAAAAAVYAHVNTPILTPDGVADTPKTDSAPKPNRDILNYHNVILSTLQADDTIINAELQVLAANDAVRAPLVRVQEDEQLKQSTLDNALKVLKSDPTLENALLRAIVNLKDNTILTADDIKAANAMIQQIQTMDTKPATSGLKHQIIDQKHTRIAWHCLTQEADYCLLTQTPITIALPEHIQCHAANDIFVTCHQGQVDTLALFNVKDCQITTNRDELQKVLAEQTVQTGTVKVGEQEYEFKKSTTNDGYTVATAVVIPKPTENIEIVQPTIWDKLNLKAMGMTGGAFAIMLLLGWLCMRKREETSNTRAISNDTLNTIKEELAKTKAEKESLKKQLDACETSKANDNSKIKQLEDQLEYAKKAYQKEQITRMSLEEEKQQLEDAMAANKISQHTAIENISHFADHSASLTDLSSQDTNSADGNFNRITAPAEPEQLEALASEKSQSFFDALTDDAWDDIADSFDALFSTGNAKSDKSIQTSDHISTSILPDNEAAISTSFLNAISSAEPRTKSDTQATAKVDTDTKNKAIHTPNPSTNGIHAVSKSIPTLNAVRPDNKSGTLNAALSLQSSERKIMPSAHDLAVKNATASSSESFKPAPSWTGKKLTDTGMDQNTLYDALKRRARDVSEISTPAAGSAQKSGVFDFNIGLSKSGVFSVTGSRVDIDPLSDTEYFKSLYEKYIETQKQCGEATNKFTLEQFVSRLAREKEKLMETHHCRNVRFSVYIKEGKASLKATPQR